MSGFSKEPAGLQSQQSVSTSLFNARIKAMAVLQHAKRRLWCLTFHAPVLRSLGGHGGTDPFGRRRKSWHSMGCVKCGNNWEQADKGEKGAFCWHWRKSEIGKR